MKKYMFGVVLIISSVSYAPPKNKVIPPKMNTKIDPKDAFAANCLRRVFEDCPSSQVLILDLLFKEMMRRSNSTQ